MDKISKRRQVRMMAVQVLYQLIDAPSYLSTEDAIAYVQEAGLFPEGGYGSLDATYLNEVIQGVQANQTAIDQQISQYLKGWTLAQIAKIDLAILRLAFYEMHYIDESIVPTKVAVNEAIELSREFSDETSRKFINGVLNASLQQDKA